MKYVFFPLNRRNTIQTVPFVLFAAYFSPFYFTFRYVLAVFAPHMQFILIYALLRDFRVFMYNQKSIENNRYTQKGKKITYNFTIFMMVVAGFVGFVSRYLFDCTRLKLYLQHVV